jgi:hypothetical protein
LPPWLGWPLWNICVTYDHGYVPLVVNTSRFYPHSWLISGFVTRLIRRVPLVEQELLTLPEHLSSPLVFSWVCVTRSLALCLCFVDRCLSFCTFSFGHCVLLRYTDCDYPFGIFNFFLQNIYLLIYFILSASLQHTYLHMYFMLSANVHHIYWHMYSMFSANVHHIYWHMYSMFSANVHDIYWHMYSMFSANRFICIHAVTQVLHIHLKST